MRQIVETVVNDEIKTLILPSANALVMDRIRWGKFDLLFTPAYWAAQSWISEQNACLFSYRIGSSLSEEIAACLLGGFGMSADMGIAAFHRIKTAGLLSGEAPSDKDILQVLNEPLIVNGRKLQYRYPKQRSRYLALALERLRQDPAPQTNDLDFRRWLLSFSGIGPKTASWITRNWLNSNNVAIIDIHIQRAGIIAGLFSINDNVAKSYFSMEKRFLNFAASLGVVTSKLDHLMWHHMRHMNNLALNMLH